MRPLELAEAYAARSALSKRERLRLMWTFDESVDSYSPELKEAFKVSAGR